MIELVFACAIENSLHQYFLCMRSIVITQHCLLIFCMHELCHVYMRVCVVMLTFCMHELCHVYIRVCVVLLNLYLFIFFQLIQSEHCKRLVNVLKLRVDDWIDAYNHQDKAVSNRQEMAENIYTLRVCYILLIFITF